LIDINSDIYTGYLGAKYSKEYSFRTSAILGCSVRTSDNGDVKLLVALAEFQDFSIFLSPEQNTT
jgi:hypothetical protein